LKISVFALEQKRRPRALR